jgi:hypothetical protein
VSVRAVETTWTARYVAPFLVPGPPTGGEGWVHLNEGALDEARRRRWQEWVHDLDFFVSPLRDRWREVARYERLEPPAPTHDGVWSASLWLFPGQLAFLVLALDGGDGEAAGDAPPRALVQRLRDAREESALWGELGRLCAELWPGRAPQEIFFYGRRPLTWALWQTPAALDAAQERAALFALVTGLHEPLGELYRPEAADALFARAGVATWAPWAALSMRDNVAFVLRGAPANQRQLARMLAGDMFHLYLLALYLKLWPLRLMERLARPPAGPGLEGRVEALEALQADYLAFSQRFCFPVVTRNTAGAEVFAALREALGLEALRREVLGELELLHRDALRRMEDAQRRAQDEVLRRLARLERWVLPLNLALAFLGMNVLIKPARWGPDLLWFLAAWAGAAALLWALRRLAAK